MTDQQTAADPVLDDPAQLRALAAQHRADAAAAKVEADAALQEARDEAARLVAEANRRAQQAAQRVLRVEHEVTPLEERAGLLDAVEVLRQQVDDTAAVVVALSTEANDLAEQIAALGQRLSELGAERENTAAALATAREAGDVDEVTALRTRLAAVDEVTGVLQGQRQTAQERLTAIGTADGTGELASAAHAWQSKQTELRRTQNALDPDSPQAEWDRLMGDLQAALVGNAERIRAEQAPQAANPVLTRTGQHR